MHRLRTWQLFAICVLVWSTTWYAILFQVDDVPPEAGVAYRFGLAGLVILATCALRGERLRFTAAQHGRLALQGAFMYGVAYVCVYHAELHVVSGLVAVGYSASPLVTGIGARFAFGAPLPGRFVLGGMLALAGVALIFWPEVQESSASSDTVLGAAFTVASVALSAVGSLTASRNRQAGLPFWPALGYGMVYGAAATTLLALALGQDLAPSSGLTWWAALLYLSLAGSVLTFASFLTLQERIGPGPAGTIGVMTPLLALVVSMAFEGFRPGLLTLAGGVLAVIGNTWMLRRRL
jgi:drug/metabolite transporter (DMT)-like permease